MPLHLADRTAVLDGVVTVEDAEPLAAWLRTATAPEVDLSRTTHLHTAALQCLLAAGVEVVRAPADPFLSRWVLPLLPTTSSTTGETAPATPHPTHAAEAARTAEVQL